MIIELLQIPAWLGAAIMAIYISNVAVTEERAWKLIASGIILAFLRVIWKFIPLYETTYNLQALRYIIGAIAAVLIFYGFFEYYTESAGIQISTKDIKIPIITATVIIASLYLLIHIFPPDKMVITHIRLVEQHTWIIFTTLTILIILHINKTLTNEGLNNGIMGFLTPFSLMLIYYSLSNIILIYNSTILNTQTVQNLRETIEVLPGPAFIGAFLYLHKKSFTEQRG